jgi:hypothetical protein
MFFGIFRLIGWLIKAQLVICGAKYGVSPKRSTRYRIIYCFLAFILFLGIVNARKANSQINISVTTEETTELNR